MVLDCVKRPGVLVVMFIKKGPCEAARFIFLEEKVVKQVVTHQTTASPSVEQQMTLLPHVLTSAEKAAKQYNFYQPTGETSTYSLSQSRKLQEDHMGLQIINAASVTVVMLTYIKSSWIVKICSYKPKVRLTSV